MRELLPTDDGWLIAAPYEYTGTKAADTKYDAKNVAGDYEFRDPRPEDRRSRARRRSPDKHSTDYRGVNKPVNITLTEDGKVTGDKTGTWKPRQVRRHRRHDHHASTGGVPRRI